MGQALTESKRVVKKVSLELGKQQTKLKEEVKKASAVLEVTKTSSEVAKKVSYYLFYYYLFRITFFPVHSKGRHHTKAERRPAH